MQHVILSGIGGIAIHTAWSGRYLNFVKPGLRWWLLIAGAVVLALGVYGTFADEDGTAETGQEDTGAAEEGTHHAHHGPGIGWLLVVPFLVVSLIVPPALGAFSAERDSGALRSAPAPDTSLPRLPTTPDPVTLTLREYSVRAIWEKGTSLTASRVRLVGFVSSRRSSPTGQRWFLTRMAMSCCAADAWAIKVDVRGGERLPDNTWVAVTGRWVKTASSIDAPDTLAALQIESMQTVTKPAEPYEY